MTTARRRSLLVSAGALVLVMCLPTRIDSARWWRSPHFINELDLSRVQRSAIDGIYQRDLDARLAAAQRARIARARFQQLLESDATEPVLADAASELVDADTTRRRLRTMMLYRMYVVLTPTQRARFAALAQRRRLNLR